MRIGAGLLVLALMAAPAQAGAAAKAVLRGADGSEMGLANFRAAPHGILIEIALKGLAPGAHGLAIHMSAECNPHGGFASAGPVLSFDEARPHGYFAKGGPRAGDLPMQFAGSDGVLHASIFTTALSLGDGSKSIFDKDGASLIVNAAGDDYLTQPDGKAGARIACGTITRTVGPKEKKRR